MMHTKRDIPVNLALVWSQGERIDEWVVFSAVLHAIAKRALRLVEKELAASSGAYNYGLARVKKDLVREYAVIPVYLIYGAI